MIYYRKINNNVNLKLFLIFLLYSLLTEAAGTYYAYTYKKSAIGFTNTWNIINFLFYSSFFHSLIINKIKKRVIKLFIFIYLFTTIIYVLRYQDFFYASFVFTKIVGNIFLTLTVLMFFYEILQSNKIFNLNHYIFFWISLGVLIYSLGFIPVFIIAEYISFLGVYRYVAYGLNLIVAACFITGFIVSKKEYNH